MKVNMAEKQDRCQSGFLTKVFNQPYDMVSADKNITIMLKLSYSKFPFHSTSVNGDLLDEDFNR